MQEDSLAKGLPIWVVAPGSPSEKAGLQVGDVILFANGIRTDSLEAYVQARQATPGTLSVTVQRGNQVLEFEFQVQDS